MYIVLLLTIILSSSQNKPSHFLTYLCLAGNKHAKPRLSLFKFFSDFPGECKMGGITH